MPATGTDGVFGHIPVGRKAIITAGGGGEMGVPEGEEKMKKSQKKGLQKREEFDIL